MSSGFGRHLQIGPTDRTSELRTPSAPLFLIPPSARPSFVPYLAVLPGLRAGENDLTRTAPGRPLASGEVIEIHGRLLDEAGRPLRNTLVEIWNANKWGRYLHVADPAREPIDPNFFGFGRTVSDENGHFFFRTIRPGAYLARPDINRWRPSHVHFSIRGGSSRLITQMYFEGDRFLAGDPAFNLLGAHKDRHFGKLLPSTGSEAQYEWNIVVGGRNPNYFE